MATLKREMPGNVAFSVLLIRDASMCHVFITFENKYGKQTYAKVR